MPYLTIHYLKKRLRWPHVVGREDPDCTMLSVLPTAPGCSSIDFIFDPEVEYLHSVHFFSWRAHCHYESYDCELRNIVDAIRDVYSLVHHHECLVECLDSNGEYVQADQLPPGDVPNMIQKRAKQLRRTFFNRAPTLEPIDYSNYIEEECHFVEKSYRAGLDGHVANHQSTP
jgi:hypothetical protein